MKLKYLYLITILVLGIADTIAQTTIVSDGLNNSSTLFTPTGGTYFTGNSAAGDSPASSPFAIESTHGYGISNGTATLTSVSNINTSGYTGNSLTIRLASFSVSSSGNGADTGDIATVEVSPNGGTNWYSTVRVLGISNACWSYSGIGIASTAYDGDASPVNFQPAAGGLRTTDGYSTVVVTGIPSTTTLRVRITLLNDNANERWIVDDFKVTGTPSITSFQSGNWSSTSTWVGGVVPASAVNAIIAPGHTVTMDNATYSTRNSGTITTVDAGGILATNLTYTNNGTLNVNGSFQLNDGGWANGSNFTYGSNGTLIFNNTGAPYGIENGHAYWPASSGPVNVTVSNTGGITLGSSATASRTVSGIFQTSDEVNLANSSVLTISGTCRLNSGGYFNNAPTYTSASTLVYNNTGSFGVGSEWTGSSTTAGTGIPQHVTIQNSTAVTMPAANRGMAGNLNVTSGSLILNAGSGDFYVAGTWTRSTGTTFTPNNRAVFFNGSGTQTVTYTSGTEIFNFVRIEGSGTLQIGAATNMSVTGSSGLTLASSNGSSTLDLNGRTLTLSGGGNLSLNSGNRKITSSSGTGRFEITTASLTISSGGTLSSDTNSIIDLKYGLDCGTGSLFTINGTLQINASGFCFGNSPKYGSLSTLQYNSGANPYNRQLEWTAGIAAIGTIGLPTNVQISNNTKLNYINGTNSGAKGIAGNLTIDAGAALYMDYGSVSSAGALTITGNLTSAGDMTLGFAIGDDLSIGGNILFTSGYTFDPKGRAVIFTKSGTQTITSSSTPTFHYLNMTSGSTTVQLAGTNLNITAPNTGNVISFSGSGDTFDLNGRTLTLGTAAVANTISGSGTFKGSATSNLTLLGGAAGVSLGTLRFTSGSQVLGTFIVNRQSAVTAFQLGTPVTVNTTLTMTSGHIDLNGQVLTLANSATTTGASANSFVFADATGSEFRKSFSATGSFAYPVGDNTSTAEYSPATVNITSGTMSSAYVGVYVRDIKHPSNIAPTDYLSRYWGLNASGITGTISYSFIGTYTAADINGTEANSKPGRFDGTDWTNIGVTSISSNTLSMTGISTFPATNQFTAGAPLTDANYYFRSAVNGGSWSNPANWQVSADNSTGWATAVTVPNTIAAGVTIRSGFALDSNGTATVDDLTIDTGASMTISGGTFTVNNGAAATDLRIDGTLTYSGGSFVQNGSASVTSTGTYVHSISASSLTLPTMNWHASSTCTISGLTNGGPISASTMGQAFGNLNWNNALQGSFVNIESSSFSVAGTLTVGPTSNVNNKLSLGNAAGTYNNTINTLVVSGGQFNGIGNTGTSNLNITNGLTISGGKFVVSDGSGTANIIVGTDIDLSGTGSLVVLNNASSPANTLVVNRDITLAGTATIVLEAVSSGNATINVGRDFTCTSTSTRAVDFGTGTVANNIVNIGRHFTKSGTGMFYTTSATQPVGFAFSGTATQSLSYSGTTSNHTSYLVKSGATVQLASDLTLGTLTNPASHFVVANGGTLNFGTSNAILAGNTTDPQFVTAAGSTLITSNTSGFGGTVASGSIKNFGSINTAGGAGRVVLPAGVNYTLNGNTTTPFPNGTFGNPAAVTINATVVSNMTTPLTVTTGFNVSGGRFTLNNSGLVLSGSAAMSIASGATFDNNGENQITGGGSISITGRFITKDTEGFVGTNTAIPSITPVLANGSVIEYGRTGDQAVQGSAAPVYKVVEFSGSGTKTLASANAVSEHIIVSGSAIAQIGNNTFGAAGTNLTMSGTSRYITAGTGVRPTAGGTYSLAAGTTIEFTNTAGTLQTPRLNRDYYNLEFSGTNAGSGSLVNGISFQAGGTLTVKSGGVFKLHNTSGFTGSTTTAVDNTNSPSVILEANSKVEYAGGDQTITPFSPSYYDLAISGTDIKTISSSSEILVGNELTVTDGTLQIDSEKLLTVTNAIQNTSDEEILIMNKGNLVQINDAAVNSGNILMIRTSRDTQHDDYIYFGSPIQEDMSTQFSIDFDASYMWELNGSDNGFWSGITATVPGRGYIARIGEGGVGEMDYQFLGTPNNGLINVTADSYDNGVTPESTGNVVLLANPYPSAIDAAELIQDNSGSLEGTLYFWTAITPIEDNAYSADDYASWNSTGGTGTKAANDEAVTDELKPLGMIAAGQGFFALLKSDDGITFNNSMRMRTTTDNGQFFRPSHEMQVQQSHRLWLNLTNAEGAFRQTLVGYVDGATNGYEGRFDGYSFTGNSVNLYSLVGDKNLVIQGRALPFEANDQVPLGYHLQSPGSYTIAIDDMDGIFSGAQDIYLEDLTLQLIHNLKTAPYTFSSDAGTINNRFVLRYNNVTLGTDDSVIDENSVAVISTDFKVRVFSQGQMIEQVSIYDMRGRLLEEQKELNADEFTHSNMSIQAQPLIVKVRLANGGVVTKKVLIRE